MTGLPNPNQPVKIRTAMNATGYRHKSCHAEFIEASLFNE